MAYIDTYNLWQAKTLNHRVAVAVATAAYSIVGEASDTPKHARRIDWATVALKHTERVADSMMWAVYGNPTIQATGEACSDADLQFVVNGLVDTFAAGLVPAQ